MLHSTCENHGFDVTLRGSVLHPSQVFLSIALHSYHLFSVAVLLSVAILETPQLIQALLHSSLFLASEFLNFLVEFLTVLTEFYNNERVGANVNQLGTHCGGIPVSTSDTTHRETNARAG